MFNSFIKEKVYIGALGKRIIRYPIPFSYTNEWRSIEKRGDPIKYLFLWVLNMMNALNNCTNSHKSLYHQLVLVKIMEIPLFFMKKEKEKKKKTIYWKWNSAILIPLHRNKKGSWCLFFIESAGTDGARTRSFRLDRAVLWPIELQSHGNQVDSIHIPSYDFILIISFLD